MYGSSPSTIALFAVMTKPAGGSMARGRSLKGTVPIHSHDPSHPGTGSMR